MKEKVYVFDHCCVPIVVVIMYLSPVCRRVSAGGAPVLDFNTDLKIARKKH